MMRTDGPSFALAAAADGRYALPLAVCLRSVARVASPSARYDIHLVDDGLSADDRRRIEIAAGGQASVHWHSPTPLPMGTQRIGGRMSSTTYQKLTLGDWLPTGLERVIWLDCDLFVRRDLAELWSTSCEGRVIAAVRDELVPTLASRFAIDEWRELGASSSDAYFNAGVMLVDLPRWRECQVAERAIQYLSSHGRNNHFWDQGALNFVLWKDWRALDSRWNRNALLAQLFHETGPPGQPTSAEGSSVDPWIVHYCGRLKPWLFDGVDPWQRTYFEILDETPWSGFRPPRTLIGRLAVRYAKSALRRSLFEHEQRLVLLLHRLSRPANPF